MSHHHSTSAILFAFGANLGVAITKTGAAMWTGSGSLLAEAIHSFADCGNQVLLFIGMKRSSRDATAKHPMGFGREAYLWSMMVAITLFSVGGMFSIYEGWQRYQQPHTVENAEIALGILLIGLVLEALSLNAAINAIKPERGDRSLWQWFQETSSSELMVVIGEDIAALAGLLLAAAMLGLTLMTGDVRYDACGSILIGLLLVGVAILIAREIHSLLLGEADSAIREAVREYLGHQSCVVRIFNIWAVNHGNNVMLAIKAEFLPDMPVSEAVKAINDFEAQIKIAHPRVKWVFFEIDNSD